MKFLPISISPVFWFSRVIFAAYSKQRYFGNIKNFSSLDFVGKRDSLT
jgi:hypothetical protein